MLSSRRGISLSGLLAAALVTTLSIASDNVEAQRVERAARVAVAPANRVVTLDPLTNEEAAQPSMVELTKAVHRVPQNFRQFDAIRKGQIGDAQTLTLRFASEARLLTIKSTPDFKVEQGGSCVEGYSYAAKATCTLLVRSTPQGPGNRLGKLEITNSYDARPLFVGLGGSDYSPTISFTPSIITTVPGTSVSGAGIFSGATNIAVDGGDNLYIADTDHSNVDYIDSSGTIQNLTSSIGANAPIAVAVDRSGFTYFTEPFQDYFLTVFEDPDDFSRFEGGTNYCATGSTCSLEGANLDYQYLGALALDSSGNIFLNTQNAARLVPEPNGLNLDYIPLSTPYNFNANNSSAPLPLAVDGSDNLYTYYSLDGEACTIYGVSSYDAESSIGDGIAVAGGKTCGFSGDGGQATGAEIGARVGQMVFDLAGNLYFTDKSNQRVRRVDNLTGIITTIAGNGATGYYGDGGPATSAALNNPTGLAVDSQGQVYVLSFSTTTGTAQVMRKVGTVGALNLGNVAVGSSSTAQTVTVSNTGNSDLDFTHVGFSSGNTTDFAMDSNTTSCNFTVPLYSGRSCKIGFIFTPGATGARSAVLSITDDTVTNLNTIQASGTGYTTATLTPASISFASTTVGSSSASQKATLTNTGKAVMTISSIALSGTGAASYSDTTTCGTTLAVAATCTISVTFKPTASGTPTATLTVSDNALGGHQTVSLTGTAAAKAALAPTALTFASTAMGATSATQTVKLSNTGTAALAIASIKMAGTNPGDFQFTDSCGNSVAAGGSCTFSVSLKPTATGARSASLTVNTSSGNLTAPLSGTGTTAAAVPPLGPLHGTRLEPGAMKSIQP